MRRPCHDAETGLADFGARLYSPRLGRWLSRDPIGDLGGPNVYNFVGNNPINHTDPFGLYYRPCSGGSCGGGGGDDEPTTRPKTGPTTKPSTQPTTQPRSQADRDYAECEQSLQLALKNEEVQYLKFRLSKLGCPAPSPTCKRTDKAGDDNPCYNTTSTTGATSGAGKVTMCRAHTALQLLHELIHATQYCYLRKGWSGPAGKKNQPTNDKTHACMEVQAYGCSGEIKGRFDDPSHKRLVILGCKNSLRAYCTERPNKCDNASGEELEIKIDALCKKYYNVPGCRNCASVYWHH